MYNNAQKLFYVRRPHDLLVAYGHAMPIFLTAAPIEVCEEFLAGGNQGRSVPMSGGGPPD